MSNDPSNARANDATGGSREERNKAVVLRFNREVLERGDEAAFRSLMAEGFVNHTAPPGIPRGPDGFWHRLATELRPALSGLRVEIHAQIAEGDLVTTRKTLHATHAGTLMGVAATNRPVAVDVIDILRVVDGRCVEHWGVNTLASVVAGLREG
jgi:predicted ester cyclase